LIDRRPRLWRRARRRRRLGVQRKRLAAWGWVECAHASQGGQAPAGTGRAGRV